MILCSAAVKVDVNNYPYFTRCLFTGRKRDKFQETPATKFNRTRTTSLPSSSSSAIPLLVEHNIPQGSLTPLLMHPARFRFEFNHFNVPLCVGVKLLQ